MRKREEGNLKALQKEHSQVKKEQFRASQALHALRQVRRCHRGHRYGAGTHPVAYGATPVPQPARQAGRQAL